MSKQDRKTNPAKTQMQKEKGSVEEINQLLDKLNDTDKITKSVDSKPQTVDEVANRWQINNRVMDLFEKKINSDTKLRKKYACALMIILSFQLLILNVWFLLKGYGQIFFSDTTFNIFITGGIAEVFALVGIIVKYLFNDNLSDLLKLVIRVININPSGKNKNNKHKEKN